MNLREEGIRLLGLDLSEWKREEVDERLMGKKCSMGRECREERKG